MMNSETGEKPGFLCIAPEMRQNRMKIFVKLPLQCLQ
jgi:hypothetical protein